jgi:hypothetical protein
VVHETEPSVARHRRPAFDTGNCIEADVDLSRYGMEGRIERVWAEPSPIGNYVVASLPFFSYGIHFGDLIEVDSGSNAFHRVIKPSGLRTMRVAFVDREVGERRHQAIHEGLARSRLVHEWHGYGYVAVLLRNVDDQRTALAVFDLEVSTGEVEWEVDPQPFGP